MKICFLLLCVVLATNAAIDTSSYEVSMKYYRQVAQYPDVLKALYLVDFNLSKHEKAYLKHIIHGTRNVTDQENIEVMEASELDRAMIRTIGSVKLENNVEPISDDAKLNGIMLVLNYDIMGQILDPEYKTTENLSIVLNSKLNDIEETMLAFISARWAPSLTAAGVELPPGGLKNFFQGSDEAIESRKKQVYKMYQQLDAFVLKTIHQA